MNAALKRIQTAVLEVAYEESGAAYGAPAGLDGSIEYATDLFDRASVKALGERFIRLLEAAVTEPDRAIGSHRLGRKSRKLSGGERISS